MNSIPNDPALAGLAELLPAAGAPQFVLDAVRQMTGIAFSQGLLEYFEYRPARDARMLWSFPAESGPALCFHGCELDVVAGRVRTAEGGDVPLTNNEARLLEHMARHIGRVMSREDLMAAVLQRGWDPCDRSIDVLVTRLRQKIEADPKRPRMIRTMRGAGYVMSADRA